MRPDRWLRPLRDGPDAVADVYLFPYSGAGISVFSDWPQAAPAWLNCWGVQLPGRQDRLLEAAETELGELLNSLTAMLGAEVDADRPYALFGHSMGAMLSYRLAAMLPAAGHPAPVLLAVSGWSPVGFRALDDHAHTEAGVLEWLTENRGLPPEVLADPEALAALLPPMQADLLLVGGYRDDSARVRCPILAFAGRDDELVAPEAMSAWEGRTDRYLGTCVLPGDHYFLHQHQHAIMLQLADAVLRLLG